MFVCSKRVLQLSNLKGCNTYVRAFMCVRVFVCVRKYQPI